MPRAPVDTPVQTPELVALKVTLYGDLVVLAAGATTAYFGVENRGTRAGRVAYSANNRITPTAFDRSQPDLFGLPSVVAGRPGRSPFYPGHAFTVTFQPGQNVVWKLFTRTSTASSGSTRCPAP